jgi:hypothetical protein
VGEKRKIAFKVWKEERDSWKEPDYGILAQEEGLESLEEAGLVKEAQVSEKSFCDDWVHGTLLGRGVNLDGWSESKLLGFCEDCGGGVLEGCELGTLLVAGDWDGWSKMTRQGYGQGCVMMMDGGSLRQT